MRLNEVTIEGYLFDLKNVSMAEAGVVQLATLLYDEGHHRQLIIALPSLKVALVEGYLFRIHGKLRGDHIEVLEAKRLN
jgi:hypothetical protein